MQHTLGTAAKATGKSKTTIRRALENGRISGCKQKNGEWRIDPSELHRVFPMVTEDTVTRGRPEVTELHAENRELTVKLQAANQALERERELNRELSCRLDQSEEERRRTQSQLTALLTDQRSGIWQRFFAKTA